ncbi:MAG TPA: PRC-barrel domain-containing protein [Hyphomicrobiaceae bacterium]|nr:PRC-barrel domain-containing protein [Hyphomicrobiaceae bacterium]
MRILFCAPLTAMVTFAAVGAFGLPPSAAQPASRKALTEESAPAETIPTPKTEAPAETRRLGSVLGIEVRTTREQNVGRIVDLLASRSGQVEAAVIEFGGFLGMGSRKIAIEWSALRLENQGKQTVAILDMTRDQLRAAPEYKPDRPIVVHKALPSAPPADTAPSPAQSPAPLPVPPEQSASPPPGPKKGASVKRKRRHHTREDW